MEKSVRYNQDKPKWRYIDWKSIEPMVRVMEYGASKYAPENWRKGLDTTEILESLARHLFALMSGEQIDPESNCEHIGHIMCNSMFYKYHYEKNKTKEG